MLEWRPEEHVPVRGEAPGLSRAGAQEGPVELREPCAALDLVRVHGAQPDRRDAAREREASGAGPGGPGRKFARAVPRPGDSMALGRGVDTSRYGPRDRGPLPRCPFPP